MFPVAFLVLFSSFALAEREHKVHNIILYPEKHSWCQLTPIKQVISSPRYESVTIDNNICVGGCYSYSIPRTQPPEPGEQIQPYCDSCQPSKIKCYHVTLQSDGSNAIDRPLTFQKRVEIITNCTCLSCDHARDSCDAISTSELPTTLFSANGSGDNASSKRDDLPELLDFQHPLNRTNHVVPLPSNPAHKYALKPITLELLEKIENNQEYDKMELGDLLEVIEGHRKSLTDARLIDFTNYVASSEDLEIDPHKLKKALEEYVRIGLSNNNEADASKIHSTGDWMFGSDFTHHRHHLGEEIRAAGDVGRLVVGPHGSKVMTSVKVDVDPDYLKPNHDGLVISYENLNKNPK